MILSDVCEVYSGYALKEFNASCVGLPVIKIGNIFADGTLILDDCQYTLEDVSEKYYSKKGDIYIALSGATTGKVGIMKSDNVYIINQRVGVIRKKSDNIPSSFIKYFLLGQANRIQQEASGCAQPNISPRQIAQYEFPDFNNLKMEKITNILEKITNIICQKKYELQKLDELIRARFIEMFGDPRNNFSEFDKQMLKDTCKIVTGNTPSRSIVEYYGNYVEWIKTDNIVSGLINPTKAAESLSEKGMKVGRIVKKDSILMSCIAGSITSIGRVCITDRTVAFNQQINAIIPEKYNIQFLYVLLQISKDYLVQDINMALKGILSKSKLGEKEFIVPSMKLQLQFATFVTQVNKSKVAIQKSLDETQMLFDSLMQKYFG